MLDTNFIKLRKYHRLYTRKCSKEMNCTHAHQDSLKGTPHSSLSPSDEIFWVSVLLRDWNREKHSWPPLHYTRRISRGSCTEPQRTHRRLTLPRTSLYLLFCCCQSFPSYSLSHRFTFHASHHHPSSMYSLFMSLMSRPSPPPPPLSCLASLTLNSALHPLLFITHLCPYYPPFFPL